MKPIRTTPVAAMISFLPMVLRKRYRARSIVRKRGTTPQALGAGVKRDLHSGAEDISPPNPAHQRYPLARGFNRANLPLAAGAIALRRNAFTRTPGPSSPALWSAVWSATYWKSQRVSPVWESE